MQILIISQAIGKISRDPSHWKKVNIQFLPSQFDPTEVKFRFVDTPEVKDLIAKLPANHDATMRLVRIMLSLNDTWGREGV
jgi:hypothetical protein